ncbi:MAG: DUF445 domain-containing protein [Candidatus Rokubacteria bacterium]|nr:DUF445 domain-containing protein [Candidatus Rokubacteria bacterium]
MRTKRRLALTVLLGAAALAAASAPFRATWWGGWILAVAEAGIVGGLADWFAVTALFRRPLGLPIPHTGLIPSNWELLAARVGAMVGGRVLTREYLVAEVARIDVATLLARGAARVTRADLETASRAALRWAVHEVPVAGAGELVARVQRLIAEQPVAPLLASALDLAREHGWDARLVDGLARGLVDALDRSEFRAAVADLVDELFERYRERLGVYPRIALGFADLLGLIDRERLVAALHAGLREVARDPAHPLRRQIAETIGELGARLRGDAALIARVEAVKRELLGSEALARLAEEAARAVRAALAADLERVPSESITWLADRLERARQALAADGALRAELDAWSKARSTELIDRYHPRIAGFIEQGVHALGPEGAVRLIEEHAGDDLQFIRVNGTLVGGLAGGALYGLHLLVGLF